MSKYIPPSRRVNATEEQKAGTTMGTHTSVSDVLKVAGWHAGASANFYYPKDHPHIHIMVENGAAIAGPHDDPYLHVTMVAYSDGKQGMGGGGITFYRQTGTGKVAPHSEYQRIWNLLDVKGQDLLGKLKKSTGF